MQMRDKPELSLALEKLLTFCSWLWFVGGVSLLSAGYFDERWWSWAPSFVPTHVIIVLGTIVGLLLLIAIRALIGVMSDPTEPET